MGLLKNGQSDYDLPPAAEQIMTSVFRNPVFILLLLALVLRLGCAFGLDRVLTQADRQFLIEGDANGYWELGRKLANGEAYEIHTPPRKILRMPGFPVFLASVFRMAGESRLAARLVLGIVGTAACGLVFLLGCELVDRTSALWAMTVVSVSPLLVGFTPVLLSETLFALLLVSCLIPLAKLWRASENGAMTIQLLRYSIAAGILIALGTYVRPGWLLFAPAFAAAYFLVLFGCRRADRLSVGQLILQGLVVCIVCILCLVPWGLRNKRVSGHFVFTTLWAGASLYDGLNAQATGASDMTFFDADACSLTMTEYEVDQHYRRRSFEFIRQNPRRVVELGLIKLGRFYSLLPHAEQFQAWWQKAICVPGSLFVLAGGLIGAFTRRHDARLLFFTLGPLLYFSALHTLFVGSMRYRLPVEYPLSILAVVGFADVFASLFTRSVRPAET